MENQSNFNTEELQKAYKEITTKKYPGYQKIFTDANIEINIQGIPGHSKILGNDIAGALAKEVTQLNEHSVKKY